MLPALLAWIEARVPSDGAFEAGAAEAWLNPSVAEGTLPTLGAVLGAAGLLDARGVKEARGKTLVELGSLSPRAAAFLEASVRAGLNILVAGSTQAGKTTMLNCLASAIPGGERVVSAEEVYELRFTHPDWVALQTRQSGLEGTGEVRLRDLVKESLRMRPSRIIVGEVRAEECLDLLLALNAGLPGMCTIHANSAREALVKTCTLPLLARVQNKRGQS